MRSLKASAEGISNAQKVLTSRSWSRQDLADEVVLEGRITTTGISKQTVDQFFKGRNINRKFFVGICKTLNLSWEEIADFSQTIEVNSSTQINELVQKARQTIKHYIQNKCSIMKVLNMTKPLLLEDIYTSVHIWEKLTANQRLELSELLPQISFEDTNNFNPFGRELVPDPSLGRIKTERISGKDAVSRYRCLIVLGKPGAGKTTFLKYLALQCIEGKFLGDYVPIFVTLKDFAEATGHPRLLDFIDNLIEQKGMLPEVLKIGQGFILLDGLDEVLEADSSRVIRQIRDLAQKFSRNRIVVTCRIAAKSYIFEQFTEVEIADFDDKQVAIFVNKWFNINQPEKAENFLVRLRENPTIKELANNPLLLTLLSLIFAEKGKFKENRSEFYEEAIELLLEKWDVQRDIERDRIYKALSPQKKQGLLSKLALATFEQGNYFFKRRDAEYYIQDYIENSLTAKTEPNILDLDSKKVLLSIQAQYGLLIERSVNIYSFSHLTFHEYFVAREIVFNYQFNILVEHITEPRWNNVFLLTVGMMRNADILLLLMKEKIDKLLSQDKKLQKFLIWLNEKSLSVKASYKLASIRAFYFYRCLSDSPYHWSLSIEELEPDLLIDYYLIKSLNSLTFTRNKNKLFYLKDYAIYLDRKLDIKLEKDIKVLEFKNYWN